MEASEMLKPPIITTWFRSRCEILWCMDSPCSYINWSQRIQRIQSLLSRHLRIMVTEFLPYLSWDYPAKDVVWDSKNTDSLKEHMRECRGTVNQLCVSERTHVCIPQNWRSFLHFDSKKSELFQFLASLNESNATPEGKAKMLVTAGGERVKFTNTLDIPALQPCTQEEAHHHIMLHCAHAYITSW